MEAYKPSTGEAESGGFLEPQVSQYSCHGYFPLQ